MTEQNYGTIEGYYCKVCKGEHKRGDALFSKHFANNLPPAKSIPDKESLLTPEELKNRLETIKEYQQDLANTTEGNFKQEEMDTIFFDGLLSLLNGKLAKGNKRLDRPDREKMVNWFAEHEFGDDFAALSKEQQDVCDEYAHQILALFDEKEIRKQEREKVLALLEEKSDYGLLLLPIGQIRQALREEK